MRRSICCVAFLALAGASASASAQVAPSQAEERAREAARITEAARREAPPATFEQLLANIADPEANLRYAEAKVAEGRLDLAAATLERILLARPELDQVRLFYAAVLFRLDQLGEAEQEFRILQGRPLPPAQMAEVERYLGMIAAQREPFKAALSLSVGLHYDDNRNAYPKHKAFDVLGVRVRGPGEEEDDVGKLAIAAFEFTYDTGLQRTQEIFGSASAYLDEQTEIDQLDTRAMLTELGFRHRADFALLSPSVYYNYIALDGDKYLADYGVRLRADRPVWVLRAFVEGEIGYEHFANSDTVPFAGEQSGRYVSGRVGGRYVVNPKLAVDVWYRFRDKEAVAYEAYTGHEFAGRVTRTLPKRAFVIGEARVERQLYETFDPFVSFTSRRDTDMSLGVTYGQPLGELVSYATDAALPPGWSDVVVSLTGEYERTNSNVPNYAYDNLRAQVLFTKRFNF